MSTTPKHTTGYDPLKFSETKTPNWGPVYLDAEEWVLFEQAQTEPQKPTDSIRRGAEMLKRLYGKK